MDGKCLQHSQLSRELYDWLADRGSLTARLRRRCGGGFAVRLLRQDWGRPRESEIQCLGMRRGEVALIREVQLLCGAQPLVFARTLIPARSLRGAVRQLTHLGTKPLGEVLFSNPKTRRQGIEMAKIQPRHALYRSATGALEYQPETIWGRRTLFKLEGQPLLVNEIFLPSIENNHD
ncbi:MAG: chorismate lyase [Gammaproteobacteria bacterium]|nr:chorismate lyase [Gammaproteobacteria bacterium]